MYERHILHSLAIAQFHSFADHTQILDVGTGGGFPGIPLAIFFPACQFTLVDSIGKKIKVVNEVSEALGLKNVQALNVRAEALTQKYHFVVSRAVTAMPRFVPWVNRKFRKDHPGSMKNGIIALKGGDLKEELRLKIEESGYECEICYPDSCDDNQTREEIKENIKYKGD